MRINCETSIVNRTQPGAKRRFQKSTLAIGKKDEKSKLFLILMTAKNKTGERFDISGNLSSIFNKFVDAGKCTFCLKQPEVDLQVAADPVHLKAFLNFLKLQLCPNKNNVKTDNTLLRVFNHSNKVPEQITKLTVKSRAEFPSKGFPRTLRELNISEIGLSQMPIGILNLTNLTTLNLSGNDITKLPKAIGRLKLVALNLNKNKMGESDCMSDWSWLDGEHIRMHLSQISLSNNHMKFIPSNLLKCSAISQIDLSFNEITRLPFSIKQAQSLKEINLSQNKLKSLPCTMTRLQLSMIDLSSNLFPSDLQQTVRDGHRDIQQFLFRMPTLLEVSGRAVMKHQIPFMHHNIPKITKEILFNSPFCSNSKCETMCFDMEVHSSISLIQLNSHRKSTSDNASHFPADGPFCSRKCAEVMSKKALLR